MGTASMDDLAARARAAVRSQRVPAPARRAARAVAARLPAGVRERLGGEPVRPRWGNLRRDRPFSKQFGFDRGTPVDRWFLDRWIVRHAADVRGDCLEVLDDAYTVRLGGDRVSRADVLDIDPANERADVVADLGEPGALPADRYDCILLMQTIHYLEDPRIGLANARAALRPGGVLLLTVPATQRFVDWRSLASDRWRFGPAGVRSLLEATGPWDEVEVDGHGNLPATVAAMHGIAAEELRPRDLAAPDRGYLLVVTARAVRP